MTFVWWASGVMLFLAALLTVARMVVGPTVLNRALANDVLVSVIVCALGLEAAVNRHDTTLPILISLSLLGFLSSVSIGRFVARDIDTEPVAGTRAAHAPDGDGEHCTRPDVSGGRA